jgi:hypothetical protein
MTRLERLRQQQAKLKELRAQCMQRNDIYNVLKFENRLKELDEEIAEAEQYEPRRLGELLSDDQAVRDGVYKRLLRINLLADILNDACVDCLENLKQNGIQDFHFRTDVVAIRKLTDGIAKIPVFDVNNPLSKAILDDSELVDDCTARVDAYIKEKLGI